MKDIATFAMSGFWQFVGIALLLTIIVNGLVRIADTLFKCVTILFRGYPDGVKVVEFKKEEKDGKNKGSGADYD